MEVEGAALLYTLATLAITFAGFAALLLILRQLAGGGLTALDRFLARTVVAHCVWFALGALTPPLLALFDLPKSVVWKTSALVFGLPMLALLLSFQHRRIKATGHGAPPFILVVMVGFGSLSLVAMIAAEWLGIAAAGSYAAALLFNFAILTLSFLIALEVILRDRGPEKADLTGR